MIGNSIKGITESDKLTDFEINCQIVLARFSTKLPRSMQKEFGQVLSFIKELIETRTITSIPTSYACLRRMYIDGDAAISKKIPIPDVTTIENLSYVSLTDCVADFLLRKDNIVSSLGKWDEIVNEFVTNKDMNIFACIQSNIFMSLSVTNLFTISSHLPMAETILSFLNKKSATQSVRETYE